MHNRHFTQFFGGSFSKENQHTMRKKLVHHRADLMNLCMVLENRLCLADVKSRQVRMSNHIPSSGAACCPLLSGTPTLLDHFNIFRLDTGDEDIFLDELHQRARRGTSLDIDGWNPFHRIHSNSRSTTAVDNHAGDLLFRRRGAETIKDSSSCQFGDTLGHGVNTTARHTIDQVFSRLWLNGEWPTPTAAPFGNTYSFKCHALPPLELRLPGCEPRDLLPDAQPTTIVSRLVSHIHAETGNVG